MDFMSAAAFRAALVCKGLYCMIRPALRVSYRALGVGCFGTLLVACSGAGPERLSWEVEFACSADATATDQLTFRVLKGGCDGSEVLYEETLVRGGTVPARNLDPGN